MGATVSAIEIDMSNLARPLREPISIPEFWVVCVPYGFSYVHMNRGAAEKHREELLQMGTIRPEETSLVRYTIAEVVR